ncbi:hypothetical protein S7711_08436 [Stachybotrys chartarum IBT 7711]|uniref:Uncharacterized protein n=1 Tax=Stachybotrys chartarum (strain CBS 109288 / IBT 7711) TaxID=1280523 RepID=A0A084AIB7_STACB|nr:hypothetical protein S7711_08436 [Stachybotrys chartarum IBT 7711]KFA54145.1 hypothetical protein S40293_07015 [Stachybotrys chartarum IBT 40293]KFA78065.1 hypothetical protein S40288_05452 [Stachybotrys chartarum IBT 40288]
MKFSAILAGTFAVLASSAPTTSAVAVQERAVFDPTLLNNLVFNQVDLNYLLQLNSLDLGLFQHLALQNNLDALLFQQVFNSQVFDVQSLLRFQQLQTLLAVAQTGVLNGFDLASLQLGVLDLGLINGIAGVNLGPFINAANIPQIQIIAGGVVPTIIVKE